MLAMPIMRLWQKMIQIPITDEMKKIAERGEKLILKSFKGNHNYTGLSEDRRFYYGILGELATVELLRLNGVRAKYAPKWGAGADDGDIVVYADNYPVKVDVKTASKDFHENLWIPAKQYVRYTYDGYIGVRINGDVAEIHGYCAKKDFIKSEHPGKKIETYGVALADLRPMDRLIPKLDAGEALIKIPIKSS